MLVPKAEELVANPYRHGGKEGARSSSRMAFARSSRARAKTRSTTIPITVYYAFKQSESDDDGEASTGWETLLEGHDPVGLGDHVDLADAQRGAATGCVRVGTNALASSIVLSLRPRPEDAPNDRSPGLHRGAGGRTARCAAQAPAGPDRSRRPAAGRDRSGMAVFSRYSAVLEPDGTKMTVRSALARINEILDQVLNEQEGDFDATIALRDRLVPPARLRRRASSATPTTSPAPATRASTRWIATRSSPAAPARCSCIKPADLPWDYDVLKDNHTSNWEALHHLIKVLERDGIAPAGDFLQAALSRPDGAVDADLVKELAHLLFRIAEGNGWTKDALQLQQPRDQLAGDPGSGADRQEARADEQGAFDFDEETTDMALSNRDRIDRMFQVLAPALDDFISTVVGQARPARSARTGPSSFRRRTARTAHRRQDLRRRSTRRCSSAC